MKLNTKTDLHLTYCTNIHPGETWAEVEQNLKQYILPLKTRLSPDKPFGIGLRLADIAARELLQGDNLDRLQTWLQTHDLYVFTLNGFPYGGFHHQVVKDKVYAPDWRSSERLDYTLRLIEILTALLPDNLDGGISTLPISYKPWQKNSDETQKTLHQSSLNLAKAIAKMVQIHQNTGKVLHIDLEPEPDGMLENTAEVIDFFQDWLLPIAGSWLQQELSVSQTAAETWIAEHIRVCYDTCHFAVEYEEPEDIIRRLNNAGIKIGKIQLSSAIKIDIPPQTDRRELILEQLLPFAESTYLHQVIARYQDKPDPTASSLKHYQDLSLALPHFLTTEAKEWRTHFHVPIFIRNYTTGVQQQSFESTQEHIEKLLQLLPNVATHHLEIETYTWEVLPPEMKLDILTSIEREYKWVLSAIDCGVGMKSN